MSTRVFTDSHKLKLSLAKLGNENAAGKRSREFSDKMRKLKLGTKGGKRSSETRLKMSISAKKRAAKWVFSQKETKIETKLYSELNRIGIEYIKQHRIGRYIVDAYIPSLNLVIEADGEFWHSVDRVVKKDIEENKYLKSEGYNLLRLSEKQILESEFDIEKYGVSI